MKGKFEKKEDGLAEKNRNLIDFQNNIIILSAEKFFIVLISMADLAFLCGILKIFTLTYELKNLLKGGILSLLFSAIDFVSFIFH